MDIQKDLEEMEARMFTDELLDKILNEYWQEIAPLFVVLNGEEYEAEERAFSARLTKKQAGKFAELKQFYRSAAQFALEFGFPRGLYAGFQDLFLENRPEKSFNDLVGKELFTMPNMKKYRFFMWRNKINRAQEALKKQVKDNEQAFLVAMDATWNERFAGVLRISFYLGYRYVHHIVVPMIAPVPMWVRMENRMLITEHELGLIKSLLEQECSQQGGQISFPPEWMQED